MRTCLLAQPGRVAYLESLVWQRHLLAARIQERSLPEMLLLLEHPPVYTLGLGADAGFVRFSEGEHELHRVERGGEVTYHGPGQLVGYPILDLNQFKKDLHWYLRQLEEVILLTLDEYGILAERRAGMTGVWASGRKLAAIGIKVSRWVTMHGFALNVDPDLSAFERIVPCGLTEPVGSMAEFCPACELAEVQISLAAHFARVFGVRMQSVPIQRWPWPSPTEANPQQNGLGGLFPSL